MIKANALHIPLKSESVNCVVTSPPYWGLRKYDIPDLVWDEEDGCEHLFGNEIKKDSSGGIGYKNDTNKGSRFSSSSSSCVKCGAWRGQIGLEPTIDLYVKHILDIFKEVWRVLRKDGTCWLNVGDSYSGGHRKSNPPQSIANGRESGHQMEYCPNRDIDEISTGVKPKDLCLNPFRLALALQAAGWWVRSDIIWAKPNPMPESVKDRPTRSHEYIFLLTKSSKYFWDQQAVREGLAESTLNDSRNATGRYTQGEKKGSKYLILPSWYRSKIFVNPITGRNIRSVWNMATQPYPEAHYATFPEELVERCIKAGCQKDGVVLDPFAGSGTVIRVAEKLCRKGIGLDLGYQELQEKRLTNVQKELQL